MLFGCPSSEGSLYIDEVISLKNRVRSFALKLLLFTLAAVTVLWWQNLQSQKQLREQVLLQARQRSLHLADALAGQVQAQLNTIDLVVQDLRDRWTPDAHLRFDVRVREALARLPSGLTSHVSVADVDGALVYNSLGIETGVNVADRAHFKALRDEGDTLQVSTPVRSRLTGKWVFLVGRPLLRQGQFQGTLYLVIQSTAIAAQLGSAELTALDVVSLIHPDGSYLARSQGNEASMGQRVPEDRPMWGEPALERGTYRVADSVDHSPRTYGWHRLASGLVVSIGLADASVLAPLAPALRRNLMVTGGISLLLLLFGGVIAHNQLRAVRAQRALSASEARLREAQQLARLGSWSLNLQTDEAVWSDEVYRIFEVDPARTKPSFKRFLEWVHPDDREKVRNAFEASVRHRKPYNVVHRLLLPGGRLKYVREIGVTEYEGDRPLRSMGTMLDITEVRAAQLALQQLNDELETRVTERTRELAQLNRELEAFAYSVSHDLRTPLRSINGYACVLEEEEATALSPQGRQHLKRIQDGSRRMGQLITDLLSLAHLSRAPVHQVVVNLTELAWTIAGELQRGQPEREVDWYFEEELHAMADPGLIRVVLQNLLGNAWKYTGKTPQAQISLTREATTHGMSTFCVRDNGAGFDMAYASQLFQPFKRLHGHLEFEGSGVGLATVSRVVRRHGGDVHGEGAVGNGAAFYFSLPDVAVASNLTTW